MVNGKDSHVTIVTRHLISLAFAGYSFKASFLTFSWKM